MSKIRVLPVDLRNRIAAGEVIERPASVVKELIENSLDAGASDIKIEVLKAGKRLIRISDDGLGMDRGDALLCLERHATSKMAEDDDLFNIRTLGFRGEALPSIASVSKLRLTTGLRGEASGVSIEVSGGEVKEVRDSASLGTTVEMRDLFFNTPARKKFLKSDQTELLHIIDTVTKEALAHHEAAFRLTTDNRETMTLPSASGARERIMQIYGEEFTSGLMEVGASRGGLSIEAFISGDSGFRSTRSHQFIFINGRPIKDQSVSHAVYRAYEGIMPKDMHPIFFLYLKIDPREVDFNVHPTKKEVRFADKESVYRFVMGELRGAVKLKRSETSASFGAPPDAASATAAEAGYSGMSFEGLAIPAAENMEFSYRPSLPFIYLGDTFIALSGKGGLTLIDHHAAHERILYEKFLGKTRLDSHQLLFPAPVKLSHKEHSVLIENRKLLEDFGIELDDFGKDTVVVRSLPDALINADLGGVLSDAAASIIEGSPQGKKLREELAARIACHNSVRGKDILNQEELSRLLSDLEKAENPDQCPHGRPTRLFFSLDDLKKMFKRK